MYKRMIIGTWRSASSAVSPNTEYSLWDSSDSVASGEPANLRNMLMSVISKLGAWGKNNNNDEMFICSLKYS